MLILASNSPRRRELLSAAGYQFDLAAPDPTIEANREAELLLRQPPPSPSEFTIALAQCKARSVARKFYGQSATVLGCDTIAVCGEKILGKPTSRQHAHQILSFLSGEQHEVLTALCLVTLTPEGSEEQVEVATTTLVMDPLDDVAIEKYLDTNLWEGKAGAFGYQDGIEWVHILQGEESNVVGLPLDLLKKMLGKK